MKNLQFNSLVWGSLMLANEIELTAQLTSVGSFRLTPISTKPMLVCSVYHV